MGLGVGSPVDVVGDHVGGEGELDTLVRDRVRVRVRVRIRVVRVRARARARVRVSVRVGLA